MHVLVLAGGWSAEREVSLVTANGVREVLLKLGHEVTVVDPIKDLVSFAQQIVHAKPDVIFNALHGVGGEDGTIQGCLNILGIPYTHSGVLASALAMDKVLSSTIFKTHGLEVPPTYILPSDVYLQDAPCLPFPFVLKPIREGSSVGVLLFADELSWTNRERKQWEYGNELIAQPLIHGQEIHVAIMDNQALGTIEIMPKSGVYDYHSKYTKGATIFQAPANINNDQEDLICASALKAHEVLGCRGISRVDGILANDIYYILEVNTQPGLTPTSLVPQIANNKGIAYADIVQYLLDSARVD